jgi:hypothetical protein
VTALLLVVLLPTAAAQTRGRATVGVEGLSFLSVPDETGVGFNG